MIMKKNKIPEFKSVADEAKFWDTHSFADYWNEFKDVDVVVELAKPKEETLVLRINKDIKKKLEQVAKSKGITTSTLARMLLTEKLRTT
jgi:hypothetical protein